MAHAKDVVGVTLAARGTVEATDLVDLGTRTLSRRSDIYDVDRVITADNSQAQLRMMDDAVLSLRPNSELVIAEYSYNADTGEGRAVMELVSGGLRTLTGRISPALADSEYELRTSVGSIGIRGTHYEVAEGNDSLFFAVWDGEIDVNLGQGSQTNNVVLGSGSDYSFAEIGQNGEITFYVEPPSVFAEGHTEEVVEPEEEDNSEPGENEEEQPSEESEETEATEESEETEATEESEETEATEESEEPEGEPDEVNDGDTAQNKDPADGEDSEEDTPPAGSDDTNGRERGENTEVESQEQRPRPARVLSETTQSALNQLQTNRPLPVINPINIPTPPDVVAARVGTATYNDLRAVNLNTGIDYQVALSFQVNFTAGTVDHGRLKLSAPNSEWFALFDGGLTGNQLQLGNPLGNNSSFNFASHTRNGVSYEAEGSMTGRFFGANAEQVRGSFRLQETENTQFSVSGDYRIGGTQ